MSREASRYGLWLALLLAAAGLLYTLQKIDDVALTAPPVDNKVPRYTMNDAVLTRYDDAGIPSMHATADRLEYFDDESAHAEMLKLDVLSGATTPWHLSAPSAMLPAHARTFLLEGAVVADGNWPDNAEPVTVRTTQLWVDPDTHQLRTERGITFESASRDGSATGLRANWIDRNMNLLNDVKMHYEAKR